jgi:L-threonylcarbamoyladenylate synthase
MARFVELDCAVVRDEWVERACAGLASGALLAHPTVSVYGLGGGDPGTDSIASRLKGRTTATPILRLVFDVDRLRRVFPGVTWPEVAEVLADSFWPGPLTLVLDDGSTSGLAVRAEAHPATRAILERWDGALGSTSLNPSGAAPARTVDQARATLQAMADPGRPLLFVAAGDLAGPPPSTLLSLRDGEIRVLREGAVARSALKRILGRTFE